MKITLNLAIIILISSMWSCSNKENDVYLFSYFKGNGEDGLHLAYSYDGLKWESLKEDQSFLIPEVGNDKLMRDPCIIKGPDDLFHMVWTVSWHEKGIGYANSKDLISWSEQKFVPVMEHEEDARNCWAPEIFYDEKNEQYLIFWATTILGKFPETDDQDNKGNVGRGNNHRMYYTATKDFENFTPTKMFYDKGFNVIDASIVQEGNEFVMFIKDETNKPFTPQKNIKIAKSKNAEGPYGVASEPITGDYWAEGPTAVKIKEKWHLYFDKYMLGKYGLLVSNDLKTWVEKSDSLEYPEGLRHGTVITVRENILKNILK